MRYHVHRGGLARTVKGTEARRRIARELHGTVLAVQGERTTREVAETVAVVAAGRAWWTDLRRGRQAIYGSMLRFIDVSVALGTPKHMLLVIPAVLGAYIDERCTERDTYQKVA